MLNAPQHADDPLEGNYWTSRDTTGELSFTKRYKTHVESHKRGRELVEKGEPNLRERFADLRAERHQPANQEK
jgi:hypothetical protein